MEVKRFHTIWESDDKQSAWSIISDIFSFKYQCSKGCYISYVKGRLFRFIWKNKRDKIRREGLYHDHEKGGLRMTDIETMNQTSEISRDTKTGTGGPSQLEIYSRLYF